ncbi:hypothetical protein [Sulfurimonas sp.]|uniref:hypothetical protein n=1 Tax=Sulfurimonas sp. TaxID=2022749 RepID=UPI0025EC4BD8|nr:hypothetical protein [Sulfurimonas sp.]MBW6489005.1 hypothetical protein [Sulfurimonas sp.]
MKNEAEILIDRMMNRYDVFTISELAQRIDTSQPAISQWKKKNYIKAIASKCRELGIYDEIFGQKKPEKQGGGLFSEDTRRELNELIRKEDEEIIKAGVRDFESYKNYKKSQMKDGEDIDEYEIGLDYKFFLARNTTMELYGIDDVTVGIIKEAYNKAVKNDDLKGFRIHLMDY